MNAQAEAEMIARCRRGDSAAWDELFDFHYARAGRFVFQLAPDLTRDDVDEICQEVFLTVIKSLETFQGKSRLLTWIFRIAANKARDYRDRKLAAKRGGGHVTISLHAEDPENGLTIDPPSSAPGPDAQLMSREQMAMVHASLQELGGPCQEIIELRYFGELSYEELGVTLKLNEKTVSSRLSKCLDRMETLVRGKISREKSVATPSNPS